MKRKNYSGSDLSSEFRAWFRKEKKRISAILSKKGCTKIELNYGFYYFNGFFTAPSGQVYNFFCSDVRHLPYERMVIRTAKDYNDHTGGTNQWCGVKDEDIANFRLN